MRIVQREGRMSSPKVHLAFCPGRKSGEGCLRACGLGGWSESLVRSR